MNEGNRRYRDLVKARRPEYLATGKRHRKDQIAREIVEVITNERKGRFVRKVESLVEAEELGVPEGVTAWTLVPLDVVLLKVKQALRGRRADGSGEGEDDDDSEEGEVKVAKAYGASSESGIRASQLRAGDHAGAWTATTHTLEQMARPSATPSFQQSDAMQFVSFSPHPTVPHGASQHFAAAAGAGLYTFAQPPPLALPTVSATVSSSSNGQAPDSLSSLVVGGQQSVVLPSRISFELRSVGNLQSSYRRVPYPAGVLSSHRLMPDPSGQVASDTTGTAMSGRSFEGHGFVTATTETEARGDAAIRSAYLRAGRPPQARELHLELSLLEVQLLCVMCSHGIPSWCTRGTESQEPDDGSSGSSDRYSWHGFAALLQDVSSEWETCDLHSQRCAESSKAAGLPRILRATRKQVAKLAQDPAELSRRAVALLECLVRLSESPGSSSVLADTPHFIFEIWLRQELCRWAASLELMGEQGRPVPCCSQTLLDGADQSVSTFGQDTVTHMASFDRGSARDVVAQVSCITRLRDIVEQAESSRSSSYLVSRIAAAAGDCMEANRVWMRRPNWWGSATTNPVEHDVQLIRKLAEDGFRGVLQDDDGSDRMSSRSMWKLLSKAAVEERATQLLEFLHAQQESEDHDAVLRKRRRRFLADLGLPPRKPAERESQASAKRPRIL